ncbi:MAG: TlpA family protein disulfide reductase, partial [Saprospiraceae bacterium]
VEKNQLKSQVIALVDGDFNSWIDKVSPQWSGAIPVTVIYNAEKRHFYGEQFPNYEELEKLVKAFL